MKRERVAFAIKRNKSQYFLGVKVYEKKTVVSGIYFNLKNIFLEYEIIFLPKTKIK